MPFGLQTKGVIVGIVLAMFVFPFIMGKMGGRRPAGR